MRSWVSHSFETWASGPADRRVWMQSVVSKHKEGGGRDGSRIREEIPEAFTQVCIRNLSYTHLISLPRSLPLSLTHLLTHLVLNHSIHDGTAGISNTISPSTVRCVFTLPDRIPDRRNIRQPSRRRHIQLLLHRPYGH